MPSPARNLAVGVVGATGAVGREMLTVLDQRSMPLGRLALFASPRSVGSVIPFGEREVTVGAIEPGCFRGLDVVLLSAGSRLGKAVAPVAVASGAYAVDNSSAFRSDAEVPLVVPEVNGAVLQPVVDAGRGIVANPNCSTIQLVVALAPLDEAFGLERVTVCTYQSVSGAGQQGIEVLRSELRGGDSDAAVFGGPIAGNVLPVAGGMDGEHSTEELKLVRETRKILGRPGLRVAATAARVPVERCHSEAVHVELRERTTAAQVRDVLERAPGVVVLDRPDEGVFPTALQARGQDPVFVGRIRQDPGTDGFAFWVVADNLRKGAALNAVQIVEQLAALGAFA